jgi:hypothetical protein
MSQQYETLISLFYKSLNEIEIKNCLACFYESNSQKRHTCYGLQRSIDGKETKFLFSKDALELNCKYLKKQLAFQNHIF